MLKVVLGVILGVISLIGLISSIIALYAVIIIIKKKKASAIYQIAASNLFIDIIQLILSLCYLTPSVIFDSWLFPGGRSDAFTVLLGATFLFCWYNVSMAQFLMAIHRLFVVCFPNLDLFTTTRVRCCVGLLYPLSLAMAYLSQYGTVCCQFSFDHNVVSYSYTQIGDTFNYSNMFIDLPLNSSSSIICFFCYTAIIVYVHVMNKKAKLNNDTKMRRRMKEYSFTLQFLAVSIFYLFAWTFFRIFPILLENGHELWYSIIAYCSTINNSSNAIVYLIANKEVQSVVIDTKVVKIFFSPSPKTTKHLRSTSNLDTNQQSTR